MKTWKVLVLVFGLAAVVAAIGAVVVIRRGFAATAEPSRVEAIIARTARDMAIPTQARRAKNPLEATPANLEAGREDFLARCAGCHGHDGGGTTPMGRNLYPRVPDLRAIRTQDLTDGELHYIIQNGVQLTGMPAWGAPGGQAKDEPWKLTLFIRSLRPLTAQEATVQARAAASAHYVGSSACAKCHADIYARWKQTPMANVVRDPREFPHAIIPDLATNTVSKFSEDQVALVYGSLWKQRYFTKVGSDYFPLPVQWEVGNRKWSSTSRRQPPTGGWLLPARQHAPADRTDVRRLPLGWL